MKSDKPLKTNHKKSHKLLKKCEAHVKKKVTKTDKLVKKCKKKCPKLM